MTIGWIVKIHKLVITDDLRSIDPSHRDLIFRQIEKKLTVDPEGYGKPLSGDLAGYWRLRVEDYRVIYRIKRKEITVLVIKVGVRRDDAVYKELMHRLKAIRDKA